MKLRTPNIKGESTFLFLFFLLVKLYVFYFKQFVKKKKNFKVLLVFMKKVQILKITILVNQKHLFRKHKKKNI